ncbi:hypothetical protein [Prosthecobacter vanneervenii]|uniref:Uncharacterized protein n=1 Tax=Prosthecobacter vanneervenii TaxID=48466 RepID=A0A7W8DKK8_9BACT|nr:hypothetical protein [Prosthecobacter vanneervenii]MBB5033140.1 hypothetical protein [Prosthecobacter vanneervenii]
MSKKTPSLSTPSTAQDDALMGRQLTEQYKLATSGMQQVVIFGAMMMRLRELHPEMTQRGGDRKSKSNVDNDRLTLAKWLEKYAPEVKRPTALRFLHVTEAICEDYAQIVGAKTAKLISLPDLVTTPAKQLPKGCEEKQLSLFEYINGTSQKSWLDRFSPESPQKRGSSSRGNDKPRAKTAAELKQDAANELTILLNTFDAWFVAGHHTRIDPDLRTTADAALEAARKKLQSVK